jgi:hypothetical protein
MIQFNGIDGAAGDAVDHSTVTFSDAKAALEQKIVALGASEQSMQPDTVNGTASMCFTIPLSTNGLVSLLG